MENYSESRSVGFGSLQVFYHNPDSFDNGSFQSLKLPIQYALYYPERRFLPGERLDFWKLQEITFEKPDMETFRGLKLAFDAAAAGGSMPTVYNAANERAVAKFLDRKIAYLQIPEIIETCMGHHTVKENPSVEEILDTEQAVYEFIESRW